MIRKATLQDIDALYSLLEPRMRAGTILPRTLEEIAANLRDFFLYEREGVILGACSLAYGAGQMAEVRSLVVAKPHAGSGIGTALVQACIDDALALGYRWIFALTYVVPLFQKLGFRVIDRSELPEKIWKDCQACFKQANCDETAVIRELVTVPVSELPQALTRPGSDPAVSI